MPETLGVREHRERRMAISSITVCSRSAQATGSMLTSTRQSRAACSPGCTNRRCLRRVAVARMRLAPGPGLSLVYGRGFSVHRSRIKLTITFLTLQWFPPPKPAFSSRRALTFPSPPIERFTPAGGAARGVSGGGFQQVWQEGLSFRLDAGVIPNMGGIARSRLRLRVQCAG